MLATLLGDMLVPILSNLAAHPYPANGAHTSAERALLVCQSEVLSSLDSGHSPRLEVRVPLALHSNAPASSLALAY